MKSLAIVLGFGCLLAIAFAAPQDENDRRKGGLLQEAGGRASNNSLLDVAQNATAELIRNLVVVVGSITEGVQLILDGICCNIFKLYTTFIYPLVDCLTAILGIQDALCGVSDNECIRIILKEASDVGRRTSTDDLIGIKALPGEKHTSKKDSRRTKRSEEAGRRGKQSTTVVVESTYISNFLAGYPPNSVDRKYAILTLKLLALVVEVILFLSIRVHLPVLLFCPAQRKEFQFDKEQIACPFKKGKDGQGKGEGEERATKKPRSRGRD